MSSNVETPIAIKMRRETPFGGFTIHASSPSMITVKPDPLPTPRARVLPRRGHPAIVTQDLPDRETTTIRQTLLTTVFAVHVGEDGDRKVALAEPLPRPDDAANRLMADMAAEYANAHVEYMEAFRVHGLPPEKWSSLRYGFEPCGGCCHGTEEAYG